MHLSSRAASFLVTLAIGSADWLDEFLAGSRALEEGRIEEARASFERSSEALPTHAPSAYQLACTLARAGDVEAAFAALERAIALGYDDAAVMRWDSDLAPLHEDPRFEGLLEALPDRSKDPPPAFFLSGGGVWAPSTATPDLEQVSAGGVIWDVRSESVVAILARPGESCGASTCSPDGRFVVVCGEDRQGHPFVRVHDAATGDLVRDLPVDIAWKVGTFDRDGQRLLLAGSPYSTESVWDTATWTKIADVQTGYEDDEATTPQHRWSATKLSPDGTRLFLVKHGTRRQFALFDVDEEEILVPHVSTHGKHGREKFQYSPFQSSFAPDGTLIAVGDVFANEVTVLDARTGDIVRVITSDEYSFDDVEFTNAGCELATLDGRGRVTIWDAATGSVKRSFALVDELTSDARLDLLRVSPEGTTALVRSSGAQILAFDLTDGRILWTSDLDEIYLGYPGVPFTSDGRFVLASSRRMGSFALAADTGRIAADFNGIPMGGPFAIAPHGRTSWSAHFRCVREIDAATGRMLREVELDAFEVDMLAVRDDGDEIAAIDSSGRLHVVDLRSGVSRGVPDDVFRGSQGEYALGWELVFQWPHGISYSPGGSFCAVWTKSEGIDVFDTREWKCRERLRRKDGFSAFAWSPNGTQLAVSTARGLVEILDLTQEPARRTEWRARTPVEVLAFQPDGARLWIGDAHPTLAVCDVATGERERTLDHSSFVTFARARIASIAFSPDGETAIVSGGFAASAAWSVRDGKRLWDIEAGDGGNKLSDLACFSPDGERVVLWTGPLEPRIVDAKDGSTVISFEEWSDSFAFSSNGRTLLATSSRGIDFLDPAMGAPRVSRIEMPESGWLLHTPSGFFDGTRAGLDALHMSLPDRSYALDGLAAAIVDPKKVAASAAGVAVAPVKLRQPPTLSWASPTPRTLVVDRDTSSVKLELESSSADGVVALELFIGDRRSFRDHAETATSPRTFMLDLLTWSDWDVRLRAIDANGIASRPLHLTIDVQ